MIAILFWMLLSLLWKPAFKMLQSGKGQYLRRVQREAPTGRELRKGNIPAIHPDQHRMPVMDQVNEDFGDRYQLNFAGKLSFL
jgi:hypothetical protein